MLALAVFDLPESVLCGLPLTTLVRSCWITTCACSSAFFSLCNVAVLDFHFTGLIAWVKIPVIFAFVRNALSFISFISLSISFEKSSFSLSLSHRPLACNCAFLFDFCGYAF